MSNSLNYIAFFYRICPKTLTVCRISYIVYRMSYIVCSNPEKNRRSLIYLLVLIPSASSHFFGHFFFVILGILVWPLYTFTKGGVLARVSAGAGTKKRT